MSEFLLYSILGSVVLTVLLNVLPMIFPKSAQRTREKIEAAAAKQAKRLRDGETPRVRVFFPWKWMLLASIVLTVLVNAVSYFAGR